MPEHLTNPGFKPVELAGLKEQGSLISREISCVMQFFAQNTQ